jgi:hypothetical protein
MKGKDIGMGGNINTSSIEIEKSAGMFGWLTGASKVEKKSNTFNSNEIEEELKEEDHVGNRVQKYN